MRNAPTSITGRSPERGVALILTLAILALVTLLVIAFVTSMRVENMASKNFNDVIKARELAQAGVDEAVGAIRAAAPIIQPASVGGSNYVTAPGVIYTYNQNFSGNQWKVTPLFTSDLNNPNGSPSLTNDGNEVDLNANNVITGVSPPSYPQTYPTNGVLPHLWVGWSNVVATVNGVNQLVGRYAYWVDDESAKVDVNVAQTRGNDLEGYTPAAIDLGGAQSPEGLGFSATEVSTLTNYTQAPPSARPLDTIESMMMTAPPLVGNAPSVTGATFSNTQFYTTVHSTSPEITPWGTAKLNVNAAVANALTPQAAVTAIANYFTTTEAVNIGNFYGKTFPYNLQQIAANIVDYIRPSAVAQLPTDSSTAPTSWQDITEPSYLGLRQTPYINELVISNIFQVAVSAGVTNLTVTTYPIAELWYMYTNHDWAPVSTAEVLVRNIPTIFLSGTGAKSPVPSSLTFAADSATITVSSMPVGTYRAFTATPSPTLTFGPFALPDPPFPIIVRLSAGTVTAILRTKGAIGQAGRLDYAEIPVNLTFPAVTINNLGTFAANWESACNDPRVKPISNDWQPLKQGNSTLGAANANVLNLTVGNGTTIHGDGDMSCHIISGSNQRGMMYPGEMGFIHTGIPWRTFWLEPQPSAEQGAGVMPDWAILDLISATDQVDVVGRININQAVTNSVPTLNRLALNAGPCPLSALLTNLQGTTYTEASAEKGVYDYYLNTAPTPRAYDALTLGPGFCPYAYTSVGEIANTPSLTAPTTPANKAVTETPIRDIANLVTPRSNTFTIWCLAQSVKKVDKTVANLGTFTPGVDIVTGEAKVQAIVERTVDISAGPPGQVKFRTLYYRYYYQ